jgi:phosphoglycerate dehydrogenase-like enzyme
MKVHERRARVGFCVSAASPRAGIGRRRTDRSASRTRFTRDAWGIGRAALLAALVFPICTPCAAEGTAVDPNIGQLITELGLKEAPDATRADSAWRRPSRIVVQKSRPDVLAFLQPVAPGVELVVVDDAVHARKAVAGADALIGSQGFVCDPDLLAAGRRLRWLQAVSAGVEACGRAKAIAERHLVLTNMQRIAAPAMAEHVMAMLFALARGLNVFIPRQALGNWDERVAGAGLRTLEGKTLLVVGLGGIGTEVARRAHAIGMQVVATRASGHEGPDFVSYVGLPEELPKLAATADAVVNCTPLTAQTRGLFDAKFFAVMKATAYFVNVGRGASVVTADLLQALQQGRLGGAALDVTDPEPLPPDHPLWHAPNVIITPHVATEADSGDEARWRILRENLRRYVAGEKMLSVVDISRGY